MARGKLTKRSLSLKAGGTNGRINAYPLCKQQPFSRGGKPSLPVIRDLAKSFNTSAGDNRKVGDAPT